MVKHTGCKAPHLAVFFILPLGSKYSHQPVLKVLHPYKTGGKMTVLYILICKLLQKRCKDKRIPNRMV